MAEYEKIILIKAIFYKINHFFFLGIILDGEKAT